MWLLKLHFSISVLCWLTAYGFKRVYKQQIKDNGWASDEDKRKKVPFGFLMFFIPIMNVFIVAAMFMMIAVKKKDFDKMCEDTKKDNEVSDND